jgi:cold shock CspA family protein
MSCRVVVDQPHEKHRTGNYYEVRIDLKAKGAEIVSRRESAEHIEYKNIHTALRDAFDSVRRQLEDYVRTRRGDVKEPHRLPHARVKFVSPSEGYGFLKTLDGREIYFHRNSVMAPGFENLEPDTEVAFAEEEGEKGPQASTVYIVGRHHHV